MEWHDRVKKRLSHVGVLAVLSVLGITGALLQPSPAASAPCPAWTPVNSPNAGSGRAANVLTAVAAASATEVWAVGYTGTEGSYRTLAMRWDGREWRIIPTPSPGAGDNFLDGVAVLSATDVWAVGSYGAEDHPTPFILHWNGSTWTESRLPALDPDGNELYGISAVSPNDIWAVGSIGCNSCKTEHSLIMHYNGVEWQTVAQDAQAANDALVGVYARATNDVWAVGYRFTPDRGVQPLTQHWDGVAWAMTEQVRLGGTGNRLNSVTAFSANDAWAAGYRQDGQISVPLIMHWQGSTWSPAEFPQPGQEGGILFGVAGAAPNDVWAVGYLVASGVRRVLIMHYDGTGWTQAQSGDAGPGARLYAVTVPRNAEPVAVGYQGSSNRTLVTSYTDPCAPTTPGPGGTPAPVSTFAPTPLPGSGSRTFPETGKRVSGLFLDYWDKNGGLPQQGFPISEMFTEMSDLNGKPYTVQYFERAVFEYHPENQAPFNVLLSQLGTFQYRKKYPNGAPGQAPNTSPGSVLFPETGKRLGGKFLTYWREHGGLPQQGFPISDEFTEVSDLNGKPYTVQYFERAVFEDHPENQPPYNVLLSQLGTFQHKAKYGGR